MRWEIPLKQISKEPLAFIAILIGLVPLAYTELKETLFQEISYNFSCDAPHANDINFTDGFINYSSRCYFSNKSAKPVSIFKIFPAVFKNYRHYNLERNTVGIPEIASNVKIQPIYKQESSKFSLPIHLGPRQTEIFIGFFAFPIGNLSIDGNCRNNADGSLRPVGKKVCADTEDNL